MFLVAIRAIVAIKATIACLVYIFSTLSTLSQ